MRGELSDSNRDWLCCGGEAYQAMLAAIGAARESICLETYIFQDGPNGQAFREALVAAQKRGVRVRVLVDAFGSLELPDVFWTPLREVGGEARQFNPLSISSPGIRNHRKLLVCDDSVAFVGGFNIGEEFSGDGVTSGWCDVGLKLQGPIARELRESFDDMFRWARFGRPFFAGLKRRRKWRNRFHQNPTERLLTSEPGTGLNPFKRALRRDLQSARNVDIIMAYFLPTWRMRRALVRVARAGGRVRLILAGKSDVWLSRLAGQSLYRRLLGAGLEIYEYQPQVLHAKLLIIDGTVYAGSSNLDHRSLNINHELMVRIEDEAFAENAREIFNRNLNYCSQVTLENWAKSATVWRRLRQYLAYFFLVRVDPYVALKRWRGASGA